MFIKPGLVRLAPWIPLARGNDDGARAQCDIIGPHMFVGTWFGRDVEFMSGRLRRANLLKESSDALVFLFI